MGCSPCRDLQGKWIESVLPGSGLLNLVWDSVLFGADYATFDVDKAAIWPLALARMVPFAESL